MKLILPFIIIFFYTSKGFPKREGPYCEGGGVANHHSLPCQLLAGLLIPPLAAETKLGGGVGSLFSRILRNFFLIFSECPFFVFFCVFWRIYIFFYFLVFGGFTFFCCFQKFPHF